VITLPIHVAVDFNQMIYKDDVSLQRICESKECQKQEILKEGGQLQHCLAHLQKNLDI
jgi:predicted DNA-binding protein YlxM (UPF0122 family)